MDRAGVISPAACLALSFHSRNCHLAPTTCFLARVSNRKPSLRQHCAQSSTSSLDFSSWRGVRRQTHFSVHAASSSAAKAEYVEEPATNVKFQTSLSFPGCSGSLTLLGTGYREKVFAIIGVKVYAAGLYLNQSIISELSSWKGQSAARIQDDASLFKSIFQSPTEKSLQIILVRDVDGKTFWDALNDAISPRIKVPTAEDESALTLFREVFVGRPLKKGTYIYLTWLHPYNLLVSLSTEGLPSIVAATIESANVNFALFDVFFGDTPVSPSLKSSVADGLFKALQ